MPADIKSILDSIIDGTNNKIPNTVNSTLHQNMGVKTPETFDAGQFREKLSMYVLKDIICAMMHDDTKDLDSMIDQSIMKHIHDDYGCSCYDYLCKSRDKLNSPILSDIIQEIDERSMKIQTKVADETEDDATEDAEDMKKSLKDIENYDQLRQQLKEVVSKKVVNDVAKVITQSNDAPVFDKLDEKLTEKTTEEIPLEADDTTNESSILKMTGTIIAEGASYGIQIPYEDGMNAAIIEYCLCEMDYLFKMDPSMEIRRRWDASPTIQEGFFDIFKKKKTEPSVPQPETLRDLVDLFNAKGYPTEGIEQLAAAYEDPEFVKGAEKTGHYVFQYEPWNKYLEENYKDVPDAIDDLRSLYVYPEKSLVSFINEELSVRDIDKSTFDPSNHNEYAEQARVVCLAAAEQAGDDTGIGYSLATGKIYHDYCFSDEDSAFLAEFSDFVEAVKAFAKS